jgi:biopolymer transport protein ExbD
MIRFFIYLIESGIVLCLFYLGYITLLRKETYYNFIRLYLVLSIILSSCIPIIHLNLETNKSAGFEKPVEQIRRFKSFYERLVYLTGVEYDYEQTREPHTNDVLQDKVLKTGRGIEITNKLTLLQKIILWIYLSGLLFFLMRFIYLLAWLNNYARKNTSECIDGYELVNTQDKVPSFSFFNRVYINKNELTPIEFKQVLAHELIHVKQKHSLDLLIAQAMTIFQWFNPLVWRLQKSMKIVHEYIADRKVVEQGYELFDYQSLLLSQLVSIRSVELVNNFNLLSIKKRIAMMNKTKSGKMAKLKAFLVIPILVAAFFVFADMTVNDKKPDLHDFDYSGVTSNENINIIRPVVGYFQEVNLSDMSFQVVYDGKKLTLNDKECTLDNFSAALKEKIATFDELARHMKVLLDFDIHVKMEDVSIIFKGLRQNNVLKTAFLVTPSSEEFSKDKIYAHLQLLPPMDAKILKKEEIRKKGLDIFEFDEKVPVGKMMGDLEAILNGNKEYILEYTYYGNTSYETFMKYCNSVRVVYQKVRNEYSISTYNQSFDNVDKPIREEIMHKFPIRLTMQSPEEKFLD